MLGALRHNLPYKILALVLSIALWADVKLHQEPYTQPVPVRLELRGVPSGLMATCSTGQVTAMVYGPKVYSSRVAPEQLTAYVDLRGAAPGARREDVKVTLAPGLQPVVSVLSVAPERVEVSVRRRVQREVPVSVEWNGRPAAGARYGGVRVEPATVTVSGSDALVDSVDRVVVRLRAGDPHIVGSFPLSAVDARGAVVNDVTVTPDTASVNATLMQTLSRQQAFVSPAYNGQPAAGYAIERVWTEPQVVTLVGAAEDLAGVTSVSTRPISVDGASSTVTRVATLVAPHGVTILPDRVTVRVRIRRGP